MNPIDLFKKLIIAFRDKREYKSREMKRVFQWRRYLEWKELTYEEKLSSFGILGNVFLTLDNEEV